MPDRDGYIAGVPCWTDTSHPDPAAVAPYYAELFGWELEDVMPEGSESPYFIGRIRGRDAAAIGPQAEGAPPMAMWNTYVWVDDADAAATKVYDAGGQVITPAFDVMDAGRMAVFADTEGAVFCVWQPKNHKGAGVVNEHGSVNFNNLRTRNVEAAKKFYGAVFGWTVLDLGGGGGMMWQLPGYSDHLEELNPGFKKGMAEMGAPDGFAEVVAALHPITEDEGDMSPHWNVTFAVDDADAAAAKSAELGGQVLMQPFDAPWVRMTVLADPQGAPFIASQFVPENAQTADAAASAAA